MMGKNFAGFFCVILLIFSVFLLFPNTSDALMIHGDGAWGSFTGTLNYSYDEYNANLSISLTNTTPTSTGGYITGFVFNNPNNNSITGITSYTTDSNLVSLFGNNQIKGGPHGYFDIGAALSNLSPPNLGSVFLGGGSPTGGIAAGQTGTFNFSFTGSGLNALNEWSFMSALSSGNGNGDGYEAFLVRFRGLCGEDDLSEFIPGNTTPEPFTMSLMGIGLLGFGILKRKHKRNHQEREII